MVMETPPSPQCVGREFVRQYYTLLNEAPAHLHRFYNNSSSFIHGGLDPPNRETTLVVGQKQIHQKIQQLNFRDCHAKISQVDSQATLGNGVVVQVTGELSNGGRPMRRFTQTFVLASQTPKKYYVHNDIFRYQDILTEEEYEEMSRNEIDEDQVHQNTVHNKSSQVGEEERDDWAAQPMVNGTSDSHLHHEPPPPVNEIQSPAVVNQPPKPVSQPVLPIPQPIHPAPQPILTVSQPTHTTTHPIFTAPPIHPAFDSPQSLEIASTQGMNTTPVIPVTQPITAPPAAPPPIQTAPVLTPQNEVRNDIQPQDITTPTTHHQHSIVDQEDVLFNSQSEPEPQQPASQTSPNESGPGRGNESGQPQVKTYANLLKTSSEVNSSSGTTASNTNYYNTPPPPTSQSPTPGMGRVDRPKPPREHRGSFGRNDENVNSNTDSSSYDVDRVKKSHFSDSQQLFIGNIPHSATENELRDIFGKFGNILDIRVLSKSNVKPGSRTPPNYGFIIFENPSSVLAVLNARPIILLDDIGTKLNVEEKKTKLGSNDGRGPPSGRGGGRPGGRPSIGSGGPPRGPPGGRSGPPSSALPQRQVYHRR